MSYIVRSRYVQDIKRKFNSILDLGSGAGHLSKMLEPPITKKVVMLDSSGAFKSSLALLDPKTHLQTKDIQRRV